MSAELDKKFLNYVKDKMPPVSETEQIALDAGDTGPEQSIFLGNIDWNAFHHQKDNPLTPEEQSFLDNETEELCRMINQQEIQKRRDLTPEVWDFIKKKKFLGMLISKEYEGLGFSEAARSAIVTKIASRSVDAAVTIMVPNSLGPGELIEKYGTQEQKDELLPRLARGEEIPCFALTEPEAGSDGLNLQAKGIVEKKMVDDEEKTVIRLNFGKRYSTLAPIATLLGLKFNLEDPDNLLGKGTKPGLTAALLKRGLEGLDMSARHDPMGMNFMNGAPKGKDVYIGVEDVIGGSDGVGKGAEMTLECLVKGRSNSLPSLSVAAAQSSLSKAAKYAKVRDQFKSPIANFGGIHEKLAEIAGLTYTLQAGKAFTLKLVDDGLSPAIPGAIMKYHATNNMRKIVNHAMDGHGGKAKMRGPRNYFTSMYNAVPVGITVEGDNIVNRNLIIFGQGVYRLHPLLQATKQAVENDQAGEACKLLFQTFITNPASKTFKAMNPATGFLNSGAPKDSPLTSYYGRVNKLTQVFGAVANTTGAFMGADLKKNERTSACLGDTLSHLYLSCTVLDYFESNGRPDSELTVAKWALEDNLKEAQDALKKVLLKQNSEYKSGANPGTWYRPIHAMLNTLENHNHGPSFKLSKDLSNQITSNTETLKNLTRDIYIPPEGLEDPESYLERAFRLACENEDLAFKLKIADKANDLHADTSAFDRMDAAVKSGHITEEDKARLWETHEARLEVIKVDEYHKDEFVEMAIG